MEEPKTRYVAVGDSDVAYQVLGDGPLDLLYCYGMGSHIELAWESPAYAEFYRVWAPASSSGTTLMAAPRTNAAMTMRTLDERPAYLHSTDA